MGKLAVLFKILLACLGFVLAGFGLLCYITTYISTAYGGGVGMGITAEFANWGLAFMLNIVVQMLFIFGGVFIAFICLYSVMQDFDYCRPSSQRRR